MRTKPNHLQLTGYRLPTEAEWEYACRSNTETSRYYGELKELLDRYANFQGSENNKSTFSVGYLKPNDFGLFDMLGNAAEWCEDRMKEYAEGEDVDDPEDALAIDNRQRRISRGGSFNIESEYLRSASRPERCTPDSILPFMGFRVARTFK
jgi:formylglycine-generating enzyme required for sulfatase activity